MKWVIDVYPFLSFLFVYFDPSRGHLLSSHFVGLYVLFRGNELLSAEIRRPDNENFP